MSVKTPRKMTAAALQRELKSRTKDELEELLVKMYRDSPAATDYLNIVLGDDRYREALLVQYAEKVYGCFFTRSGRAKASTAEARDVVREFESVCPDAGSVIDLKLGFLEHSTEIDRNYSRIPASFYRDWESMARSLAKDLENAPAEVLDSFKTRLEELIRESSYGDAAVSSCIKSAYESRLGSGKTSSEPDNTRQVQWEKSSKTTAGQTLSQEDAELFFRLLYALLGHLNGKRGMNGFSGKKMGDRVSADEVKELLDEAWKDDTAIESFLAEEGGSLSADERAIVSGWKKRISGDFFLERHLKKGSVFLSAGDETVYLVRGITTPWEEMFFPAQLPVYTGATLLPFRDVIVTDGILLPRNIRFGSGMRNGLKDRYMRAKREGRIMESL